MSDKTNSRPSHFRSPDPVGVDNLRAQMTAHHVQVAALQEDRPRVRQQGVDALKRLLGVAQSDTGQSRRIAFFLLGLYNGVRFPFDLTDFRGLDYALFQDCLSVLALDYQPEIEVHEYFANGSELFERLASSWNAEATGRGA